VSNIDRFSLLGRYNKQIQNAGSKNRRVIMNNHGALLLVVVSFAVAAAQTAFSSLPPASTGATPASEPATRSQRIKVTPVPASTSASPNRGHTFQVNDVKGLLLTCIAPQLDTDPDTDIFNSCTLAPGRTLDDAMHTFIQAIHLVQKEQAQQRAEWQKEREKESASKPAQK
jgi:hypothetical protein